MRKNTMKEAWRDWVLNVHDTIILSIRLSARITIRNFFAGSSR